MTNQEVRELKRAYGKRQANPADVLRLFNVGRRAVGLKPLELPDVVAAGYGDTVWMPEKKIGKYLLRPEDRKRFVEAA